MRLFGGFLSMAILGLAAAPSSAQSPAQTLAPTLPEVATLVKPYLVQMIPPILYEHHRGWGRTSPTPSGIHWHGLRPEVVKSPRNDGHWQKIKLVPRDLGQLEFRLSDPRPIDAERQGFQAYVGFVTGIEYEHQLWESGVRLYSGSTRARFRVQAWVDIESTLRLDTSKSLDLVFRLKVAQAKVRADHFVVEHSAGIGGSGAKLLGETIEGLVKEIEPGLQRRLQERIEAALVKAGDTREVHVGFGSLFSKRKASEN